MVFCATCNEHSLEDMKKQVSTMAFYCQLLLLLRTTASCYCCRHCCHCLSRGSSGEAGVAACGDGSGSSTSGGSGAILFLVVVVILLLFACPLLVGIVLPLFVARCSFRRPPLTRLQRTMVGCCLLQSQSRSCCGGAVAPAPLIFAPSGFSLPSLLFLLLASPPPPPPHPRLPPYPSSSTSSQHISPRRSTPHSTYPSTPARRASLFFQVVWQAPLVALPHRPRL